MEVASVPGEATPTGEAPEAVTPETQPAAPAFDAARFESVESRLGEVSEGMRALMSRIPEPQAEPIPDFGEQFEDLWSETGGMPDPGQLQSLVDQRAQQIAEQIVGPLAQQFNEMREGMTAEKLDALQQKHPELQDPARASQLVDAVVTRAQAYGNPGLANNPDFVEMVHLSEKARALGAQETPAPQGPETHLETGGGASPAQPDADPFDAILGAGRKPSVF